MKKLTQNVINILGENGKTWIANLPNIAATLVDHWKLKNLIPVDNMTYHYVVKGFANNNQHVVLKIGFDKNTFFDERKALIYFDGNASVRLIDYNEKYNALLLQQAVPGTTLKPFYPVKEKFVMDCYVTTMQKLHDKLLPPKNDFRHISDWLKAMDAISSEKLPKHLLEKAIQLKNTLLNSMKTEVLLHGDLHHDNILKNGDQWLTIDPKGIIGEPEFEIAAFDFIDKTELTNDIEVKKLFETRIKRIAELSKLNAQRIKDWVFVRLILSAVWSVEDNSDPRWAIKLAELQTQPNLHV